MVQIELTDEEAILFRDFRQYQDIFEELREAGVFGGLSYGKIIISVADNLIQNIDVDRRTYDRKRNLTVVHN